MVPSGLSQFLFHSPHFTFHSKSATISPCKCLNNLQQQQSSSKLLTEADGTGAAAPTPGDRFIERQKFFEESTMAAKISRRVKPKLKKPNTAVYTCYGCGAPLQTLDFDAPGYVDLDTYSLKKRHHQLRTVLCGRCKLLSHGRMVTAVGGNGGYNGGKQFVTADELREKLAHLRYEKALIVKLVDIVDFNGSFLTHVRDLIGANPIILVITKIDLLPKGTDLNCVGDWVVENTMRKKLNVLSVHLTSSKSLSGISGVVAEIQKKKKGRDVYILGAANVGKSAFTSALLKLMAERDPAAAAAQKYKPIQSAVPGTTLGPIPINAFLNGGKIYDTPGVHLHHRQTAVVQADDLPSLAPRSRLRGRSFPVSGGETLNGWSLFWSGLVRIDVLTADPEMRLTFYGPTALEIHALPTASADDFYKLRPPNEVEEWRGLENKKRIVVKWDEQGRRGSDVAISGMGWIGVEAGAELEIHVPKSVEVFVRGRLPVGKDGSEAYQYPDLTEKELSLRPKFYF